MHGRTGEPLRRTCLLLSFQCACVGVLCARQKRVCMTTRPGCSDAGCGPVAAFPSPAPTTRMHTHTRARCPNPLRRPPPPKKNRTLGHRAEVRAWRHDPLPAVPPGLHQVRSAALRSAASLCADCADLRAQRPAVLCDCGVHSVPATQPCASHQLMTHAAPPACLPAPSLQRPGHCVCGAHHQSLVLLTCRHPHLRRLLRGPGKAFENSFTLVYSSFTLVHSSLL